MGPFQSEIQIRSKLENLVTEEQQHKSNQPNHEKLEVDYYNKSSQ